MSTSADTLTLADIPVIDISGLSSPNMADRLSVAAEIDEANRRVGFLVITNHGVETSLIEKMHAESEAFFALPAEAKEAAAVSDPDISRGYMPPRARSLGASTTGMGERDYVEYFSMGSPRFNGSGLFDHGNVWPEGRDEMRQTWETYFAAMEDLADRLLRGFALALGVEEDFFRASCDEHCSVLFANGYPPVSDQTVPNEVRLGQHTDYGSVTILYRDERPSGLQVLQNGEWLFVPDIPGSYVVNIGDLMARWTNDRWVSTQHRVANPPVLHLGNRRLSIPFFHQPNVDAVIEAVPTTVGPEGPKYPPITSGDNYLEKTRKSTSAY
ncbi:isopenicillin N synthase family oxygenase [Gordonia jinghuaiqii]|uniref:Isopenicillin N synthase family oxygenase n=1 Tax=Gordonia jinghuaiqii TaxID=2758710 RepID=A0A7D7R460_9ACTN|nr:2-oxoglutarate and iron-dependent oxygenase domain-containing protein [Gordonia jinghuaiqii]MCR5977835.1 isopenicillin N synthase family oxygenase [Gordonia jinghuaiqii]QMT02492.1 isopenicillin N synthase family oxygenase [Gordonia jinghuaiqii]